MLNDLTTNSQQPLGDDTPLLAKLKRFQLMASLIRVIITDARTNLENNQTQLTENTLRLIQMQQRIVKLFKINTIQLNNIIRFALPKH